jgi:unsaturated rhamnogalacturonyl hydrolase
MMKTDCIYKTTLILLIIMLPSCNSQAPAKKENVADLKWSVRMANSVMNRSDSLVYYVDRNPKWAYDVAFLGMAIDRLGSIDKKYSKYMEDWVNYFVHPDGSVTDYRLKEYNLDRIFPGKCNDNIQRIWPHYKTALDNFIVNKTIKTNSGGTGIKRSIRGKCGSTGYSWDRHLWCSMQRSSTPLSGLMSQPPRQK